MSINASTGEFTWTPAENQSGSHTVTITVTDDGAGLLDDFETFTITVNEINVAPVLAAIGDQSVNELATLNFTASATDTDLPANTLTFSLDATSLAAGMTINATTGEFTWTPTEGQSGSHSVTITVTDDGAGLLDDFETFTITVNEVNVAPVLAAIGDQTVNELSTLNFTASATDADVPADNLTYNLDATSLAAGMSINATTGEFIWTPAENQSGSHSVTITVTDDGTGPLNDFETFTITVNEVNVAPVLAAIGDQTVDELATLNFTASATDADLPANNLTYSLDATSLAAGMTINASTGEFIWTPTEGQSGSHSVTITVTDDGAGLLDDFETFTITVNEINVAPVLAAIGDQTVDELATLNFTASATDADLPANNLTFSLDATSLAAGMSINTSTGEYTWTPAENQNGIYSVTITVTDDGTGTLSDFETFTITVNEINNNDPLAGNDSITVGEGGTVSILDSGDASVLANDSDLDLPDDLLTVMIGVGPGHGSLALNLDGTFSYTHDGSENFSDIFTYIVSDADGGVTDTGIVSITIIPINENQPVITPGQIFSVSESAGNGVSLGNVAATDLDTATTLSGWAITGGNSDNIFGINATTGELSIVDRSNLDFDTTSSYSLSLTVSDGLNTSITENITINITDVSLAITAGQSFNVSETATNGVSVGSVVTTGDSPVTFAITGGNIGSAFTIDNTGMITVADSSAIDYETLATYSLTVEASDGTNPVSGTVVIDVIDVNESPVGPVTDNDAALDSVAEDAASGDYAGFTALAIDSRRLRYGNLFTSQ